MKNTHTHRFIRPTTSETRLLRNTNPEMAQGPELPQDPRSRFEARRDQNAKRYEELQKRIQAMTEGVAPRDAQAWRKYGEQLRKEFTTWSTGYERIGKGHHEVFERNLQGLIDRYDSHVTKVEQDLGMRAATETGQAQIENTGNREWRVRVPRGPSVSFRMQGINEPFVFTPTTYTSFGDMRMSGFRIERVGNSNQEFRVQSVRGDGRTPPFSVSLTGASLDTPRAVPRAPDISNLRPYISPERAERLRQVTERAREVRTMILDLSMGGRSPDQFSGNLRTAQTYMSALEQAITALPEDERTAAREEARKVLQSFERFDDGTTMSGAGRSIVFRDDGPNRVTLTNNAYPGSLLVLDTGTRFDIVEVRQGGGPVTQEDLEYEENRDPRIRTTLPNQEDVQ